MKYIALSLYHSPRGRIPLFLELRALNALTSKNILQFIHSQYKGKSNTTFSDFTEALRGGYFLLLLDGFDEVSPDDRENIERQIIDISYTYEGCPVIVSGRPYERFSSWDRFSTLQLKPMAIHQTTELIDKSSYDQGVKDIFVKRLTPEFFKKHESFLDTPLLAIMLMLTFEEYAEIPSSLHEFYRNAFDTLVRRHDAMKAQFLRKTHSGCTAEEFKRVFASFCLLTYSKSAFTFDKGSIIEFLGAAIKQQRIKISPEKLLDDLIESICLLQEEGFEINFVHRSFQEYFCALFVSGSKAGLVKRYLDSGKFRVNDDVLPMLYGMAPQRVEAEWAFGAVRDILDKYPEDDADCNWKYALDMYPVITVYPDKSSVGPIALDDGELANVVGILRRFYPAHFYTYEGVVKARTRKQRDQWQKDVREALIALEEAGEPQLKGFSDGLRAGRGERVRLFRITLSPDAKDLICAIYSDDYMASQLKALRAIHREQRQRERGEDQFLKEVFAS